MKPEIFAEIELPVSGSVVTMGHLTGREDMLLAEGGLGDVQLALALIERLGAGRAEVDWGGLPAGDLDVLLLRLRRALTGEHIITDIVCAASGCGARIDVSFEVEAYVAHHRPRRAPFRTRAWSVDPSRERAGWFVLSPRGGEAPLLFRLPTVADLIAVAAHDNPAEAIAQACLCPADGPVRVPRQAEAAMQLLAPSLADEVQGQCPDCGATVSALFEPRGYCLQEMRERARFIYEDVDILAQRYGWSEASILDLPSARRVQYAELARQARAA
jgi:hypothetical protein